MLWVVRLYVIIDGGLVMWFCKLYFGNTWRDSHKTVHNNFTLAAPTAGVLSPSLSKPKRSALVSHEQLTIGSTKNFWQVQTVYPVHQCTALSITSHKCSAEIDFCSNQAAKCCAAPANCFPSLLEARGLQDSAEKLRPVH